MSERKKRLHIHRELEYLRSAGRIRRGMPPAERAKARQKAKERRVKLDEADRAIGKKRKKH